MRVAICLLALVSVAPFSAQAADTPASKATWTPPSYGAAVTKPSTTRSPFADGFAARKPGPGTKLLTAAAITALQTTSFAHFDVVDQANTMGYGPTGNPGRAGDRSVVGDTKMDHGIR